MSATPRTLLALLLFSVTLCPAFAVAPLNAFDPHQIADLFRKLDHDSFTVRQKADDELRSFGKCVLPVIREQMTRTQSVEVRSRLQRIERDFTVEERVAEVARLLGNNDKRMRDDAEKMLRAAGPSVLPVLRQMEGSDSLTAGHRRQLRQLIDELAALSR